MGPARRGAPIVASLFLALGLGACGGGPDIVEATPEGQPTLTIPGGAGAGALGEPAPAATTPEDETAPDGATTEGQPGAEDQTPGQAAPGAEPGAAPDESAPPGNEFGDFCEQNPGVQGC